MHLWLKCPPPKKPMQLAKLRYRYWAAMVTVWNTHWNDGPEMRVLRLFMRVPVKFSALLTANY